MIDHDPGDEDRGQVSSCPFCGRYLTYARRWITPLRVGYEEPSLSSFEAAVLDPSFSFEYDKLETCNRDACKAEARKMQDLSFKSTARKQSEAQQATLRRRFDPQPGFKDRDWL